MSPPESARSSRTQASPTATARAPRRQGHHRRRLTASPTGNAQAFPFEGTVAFRFPITGASPDGNRINHSGGVKLAKGHATITLSYFRINLRRGYASVVVNGDARASAFNLAESAGLRGARCG